MIQRRVFVDPAMKLWVSYKAELCHCASDFQAADAVTK
jgi:hypothetical protein